MAPDTSTWRALDLDRIRLRVPPSWVDLGTTDPFELAHVGPARSVFSSVAARFATDDGPAWLHALAHPFGGVRVFRQDAHGADRPARDLAELHAASLRSRGYQDFEDGDRRDGLEGGATGFVCRRPDRFRRRWTLRHHYVPAPDGGLFVVVLGTFAYERDEGLIEAVLASVVT